MISAKDKDMNRSRDVKGPELKRPEQEIKMGSKFHDETGVISKHPLSELHYGDHEAPLTALGQQEVVVKHPMGSDSADHRPTVAKGATKDQAHFGGKGAGGYPKQSKSMGASREPKGMGRSVAKSMMSAAKHKEKY